MYGRLPFLREPFEEPFPIREGTMQRVHNETDERTQKMVGKSKSLPRRQKRRSVTTKFLQEIRSGGTQETTQW